MIARPSIPTGAQNGQVANAARDLGLAGVSDGAALADQVDETIKQRRKLDGAGNDLLAQLPQPANLLSPAAIALLGTVK